MPKPNIQGIRADSVDFLKLLFLRLRPTLVLLADQTDVVKTT